MVQEKGFFRIRVYKNDTCLGVYTARSRRIIIGRAPDCDLQILGRHISRRHLEIKRLKNGALRVRDLGSANGTYVGAQRVHKQIFTVGVTLVIAEISFVLELVSPVVISAGADVNPATYEIDSQHNTNAQTQVHTQDAGATTVLTGPAGNLQDMEPLDGNLVIMKDFGKPAMLTNNDPKSENKIICPHCWHLFDVSEILAIAEGSELTGDPVLGEHAAQRFLPSHFTPDGKAIDSQGFPCADLACPRCHLIVPRSLTQKMPLFFSIIGSPASGKSYLLTSMIWTLRGLLPRKFGLAFIDAHPSSNVLLNDYERTLFLCANKNQPTSLAKTELHGEMYDEVLLNNMRMHLPQPLMFTINPQLNHPWYEKKRDTLAQTLVLYDNAGEHFQADADTAANPGTRHLLHARGLFFLFDPTKDPRFRAKCRSRDPQMKLGAQVERQDILFTESVSRIRRHAGAGTSTQSNKLLVVVVTKYDIWHALLKHPLPQPWAKIPKLTTAALDMDAIRIMSYAVRHLMMEICPEVVAAVETFSSSVIYIPTSGLGHSPMEEKNPADPEKRILMVRPKNIKPIWSAVPMLYMLACFGLLPVVKRKRRKDLPVAENCRLVGHLVMFDVPGTDQSLHMPDTYLRTTMRCPVTGTCFWIPSAEDIRGETPANQ